ncbi:MAG: hypothetical protein IJV00_10190 [Clostridia bacterium]|nr:hypothetical protein [Clostridia bacterium]
MITIIKFSDQLKKSFDAGVPDEEKLLEIARSGAAPKKSRFSHSGALIAACLALFVIAGAVWFALGRFPSEGPDSPVPEKVQESPDALAELNAGARMNGADIIEADDEGLWGGSPSDASSERDLSAIIWDNIDKIKKFGNSNNSADLKAGEPDDYAPGVTESGVERGDDPVDNAAGTAPSQTAANATRAPAVTASPAALDPPSAQNPYASASTPANMTDAPFETEGHETPTSPAGTVVRDFELSPGSNYFVQISGTEPLYSEKIPSDAYTCVTGEERYLVFCYDGMLVIADTSDLTKCVRPLIFVNEEDPSAVDFGFVVADCFADENGRINVVLMRLSFSSPEIIGKIPSELSDFAHDELPDAQRLEIWNQICGCFSDAWIERFDLVFEVEGIDRISLVSGKVTKL